MDFDKVVAIDGPGGSGKSTVAKMVSEKMGFLYVDTGAMYRAIGYYMNKSDIPFKSNAKLFNNLSKMNFSYGVSKKNLVSINGEDLTEKIREHSVAEIASKVSKLKEVRDYLLNFQRNLVKDHICVMEGRDIGTVIFPNSFCKIYLEASLKIRAQRRYDQLLKLGKKEVSLADIMEDTRLRDQRDVKREIAPLQKADDAKIIDTSNMSFKEVVILISDIINKCGSKCKIKTLKIVINRTDAIGDTLLTLPVAKLIKDRYPQSKLVFMVSSKSKELFEYIDIVDEVWEIDHNLSFFNKTFQIIKLFRNFMPDAYFFFGGSHLPSIVSWLFRVRIRSGLKSKWQSFIFLNKAIRQKRSMVEMHESDYNLSILTSIGIDYSHIDRLMLRPKLNIPHEKLKQALSLMHKELISKNITPKNNFIIVHPGMVGHTLNWPIENYAGLIVKILYQLKEEYNLIISFTKGDIKYIDKIKTYFIENKLTGLEKNILYFDGAKNGLSNYIALMKQASLLLAPSTGNTHLANALEIPQIAFYSPIRVQSAVRWGPFNRDDRNCRLILPDVVCAEKFDCALEECAYYECMAKIEVDDVLYEVFDLLKREIKKEKNYEANL